MKKLLLIVLILTYGCSAETALEIQIEYDTGSFEINSIKIIEVNELPDRRIKENIYEMRKEIDADQNYYTFALQTDGKDIYGFHTTYPRSMFYDYYDPDIGKMIGGKSLINSSNDTYVIPYIEFADDLIILDYQNKTVQKVRIPDFLSDHKNESGMVPINASSPLNGTQSVNNTPSIIRNELIENDEGQNAQNALLFSILIIMIVILVVLLYDKQDATIDKINGK